ncbi:FecR family protein [Sphingobium sp. RAC03]|uniref:FecR family protein n=1 Tax=Sphingobium sp. RAC03 TaxID=1843368 RepID=UPI00083E1A3E|nr:FecR domain-containing protein [Sphingobium sp. RAC03]
MTVRESSAEIEQQATLWAARCDATGLSAADRRELDAWLAGDSRRMGAWAMARATLARVELAQTDEQAIHAATTKVSATRRQILWGAGAAVAASAVAAVGLHLSGQGTYYETAKGEMLRVALPDGSVVNLNTASRIEVRFTPQTRTVILTRGEALFDVAKNKAVPFVVEAGDARVRAVGTAFTVRRQADRAVGVIVSEGVVELSRRNVATRPVRLVQGMRAAVDPAAASPIETARISPDAIAQELYWREGMIAFRDTSLAQAAAEFARYNDEKIMIADPLIAQETITGLFVANDPHGFAKAAAESLGLATRMDGNRIILGPI